MSMIGVIEAFRTTDGKLFEDKMLAIVHQNKLDFINWYCENQLYGNFEGSKVEVNEICEWLNQNRKQVLAYYGRDS